MTTQPGSRTDNVQESSAGFPSVTCTRLGVRVCARAVTMKPCAHSHKDPLRCSFIKLLRKSLHIFQQLNPAKCTLGPVGFSSIHQSGTHCHHAYSDRRLSVPFHIQLGVQSDVGTALSNSKPLLSTPDMARLCSQLSKWISSFHPQGNT